MTRLTALLCAFALVAQFGCAGVSKSKKKANTSATRIGIYDSRAIAVAFIGSEVYKLTAGKKMAEMMAEYKKAKLEGDKERVKKLKAWGEIQQDLLHKQAFSTAPVNNILEHISDQLPEIKKRVNVELFVSKWDTETLDKHKSAKHVDVTMLFVEAFKPNVTQKKRAIEIQKHNPVSFKNDK